MKNAMKHTAMICATVFGLGQAQAADLNIVTDIAPIGSLVAQVSGHTVTVLIEPGQSPHDFNLKPSQARALQNADVVIWMGEGLTPPLEGAIEQLASKAEIVELMAIEGIDYLDFRDDAIFGENHADDDDHADEDDHAHDHHGNTDPHAWLDPDIAAQWLTSIAAALSQADPSGAAEYTAQAARAEAALTDHALELRQKSKPFEAARFFVSHDAYQYLENAFGIKIVGAVTAADGASASVARIAALQDAAKTSGAVCLLTDATSSGASMEKIAGTLGLKVQSLDILFSPLKPEDLPAFYTHLMSDLVSKLTECAKG